MPILSECGYMSNKLIATECGQMGNKLIATNANTQWKWSHK